MGFYETRKALGELSSLYESSVLSEKKKDDSYLETDMKKRQANNEKARKDMEKMGTKMKNPHFEETQVVEKLDPVGQEDADIDNDGDTDSSDKYLHKRRKAISKAIKAKKKTVKEQEAKIGGGNLKTLAAKATKRIDADVDGDVDTHDPKSKEMGEFVPGPDGKKLKPKVQKEAFHDWRTDLREIISTDDEDQKEVKEKTVKNKVVIDPELKLENFMGGEVLEITESETCPVCGCDPCQCLEGNLEFDEIIESVYIELIDEGYTADEVEYGIESAITLEEGYYDSAVAASKAAARKNKGSLKDRIKSAAKTAISKTARAAGKVVRAKATAQALPSKAKAKGKSYLDRIKAVAKKGYESGRGPVEKKTSYRGAGVGRKEKIGEDVQQIDEISANLALTASQKADEMRRKAALAGDRETAAKKAQQATRIYKGVGPRRAKERMAEGIRDEDPKKGTEERKARLEKKRGMKLDDHPQYKKEEVEQIDEIIDPKGAARIDAAKKKNKVDVFAYDRKLQAQGKLKDKKLPPPPTNEEVEMDEAMKPGPRREKMRAKMHDPYVRGGSKSRGQAHNIAVRGDVSTGDPAIKSRGGGGVKKDKGMGYGDRGAGNKARRRAGQEPLRGTRMREATEDSLRDRRMERGGVDGNTRYDRAPKAPNTKKFGTGKTALQKDMEKKHGKGKSAMDIVRAEIRAKHGKGAIMDTKKK